jgi:predicted alpha/beta-hydrolase family hydrolase
MQASTVKVESRFGVTLYNSFLMQDSRSEKLLVMLPGRGYTCEHPLLYTLRRAAGQMGFDVLSVQYGFQITNTEPGPEMTAYLQSDVQQAVEPVLARGYRRVCIAGKSLGTPLSAELARSLTQEAVSLILLTPIGGAVQGLGNIPTLAIIGTADPLYSTEEVAAFQNHPSIKWKVYEGLNHSLEVKGDWASSLSSLPDIIRTCQAFLT